MKPHIRPLTLADLLTLTLTLTLLSCCVLGEPQYGDFTNEFAVHIEGGERVARAVAEDHGFNLIRQINHLDYYHFEHRDVSSRAKRSADGVVERLRLDQRVTAAHQQMLLRRDKRRNIVYDKQLELPIRYVEDKTIYERHPARHVSRSGIPGETSDFFMNFDDTFYEDQWYLHNAGQTGGVPGFDVNVEVVWAKGFTGAGVIVTVLDDGCDHSHPDLLENYDPQASTDLNDRTDTDPMPDVTHPENSHGTRCVGEIAATANNSNCGVGIAYHAHYGCVRMLDGSVTDSLEAEAMSFQGAYIHIKSASWGPSDSGEAMEGPGPACSHALKEGAEKGRGGKGTIYVWATGNGGNNGDMCGADGYVGNIHTLSIGCISDEGLSTYFTEICASTMAVIFTGGSHKPPGNQEYRNPKVKVVTTDLNNDCTLEFQGTSSAAPLASGGFALVLDANPNLTWRDMQHLVVHTARIPSNKEKGWVLNGAGFHVNERFGFGAIDIGLMVELAQEWVTVGEQHVCKVQESNAEIEIPPGGEVRQTLHTDACENDPDSFVNTAEHVEIHVDLTTEIRGAISIAIISPMGTRSNLLSLRRSDLSAEGIHFTFMSVLCWGEDPRGDWTLIIESDPVQKKRMIQSSLLKWSMTLYGTAEGQTAADSDLKDTRGHLQKKPHPVGKSEIQSIMAGEEKSAEAVEIDPKARELLNMLDGWKKGHSHSQNGALTEEDINFLARLLRRDEALPEEKSEVQEPVMDAQSRDLDTEDISRISKEEEKILQRFIYSLDTDTNTAPRYRETETQHYSPEKRQMYNSDMPEHVHRNLRKKIDGLTDEEIDKIADDFQELLRSLEKKKK